MQILTADQLREADQYTITHEPIASINLMERASAACVNWITERYDTNFEFQLICGLGNNGGDGLAIARMLAEKKYTVNVHIINHSPKRSPDFLTNYERLKALKKNNLTIKEVDSLEKFSEAFSPTPNTIVIDAIFGTGLNKPVEGVVAEIIKFVNQHMLPVIAIDVPSGLFCDTLNETTDCIFKADFTLTFQVPKLSFMFPETAYYVGNFSILDIGLHAGYLDGVATKNYFTTKSDVQGFLKTRSKIAHKGNFGHALLIAGSSGKIGAAVLSAKACMHSGVGLLTVHVPKAGYEILQTSLPEAMVSIDSDPHFISDNPKLEKYNAIGIGPGIDKQQQTQNVLKVLIQNTPVPLVIDADAINILAENKTWLSFIPAGSIFTPHPKEFERLAGKTKNSIERLQKQREFSAKHLVYVVLKGANTAISCPNGGMCFNSTGNPGMATAGSGDTLTGIIVSLMAQGYTAQQACIMGVYLHGLAGDFAVIEKSEESMTASDIIANLPKGFNYLHNKD